MAAVVLRPPHEAPAARDLRIEELELDAADLERGRLDRFFAEYGVAGGVAEAVTRSVAAKLESAHTVVIEVEHEAGGAILAVRDAAGVVVVALERQDAVTSGPARGAAP
jgi:hypothetical protein